MPRKLTSELMARRMRDGRITRERCLRKLAMDPGSRHAEAWQRKADEMDLAIQKWALEEQALKAKGK